jgi:flagellin-specific chaperone FliS
MSPTEMAYRKTAVGGASGFGLLIALYDTLAGDLRRAADAERANDIENGAGKRTTRCW